MLAFELRDDAVFLARLTTRTPLLSDLGPAVVDRFRGCEAKAADPALGEALVLCAHVDGVAAGVPSRQEWDRDRLTVRFEELLPDGTIEEVSDPVDHLARAEHARPILARHIAQVRRDLDFRSLWSRRHDAFPNLVFGPDVEEQLRGMAIGLLPTVVRRLA